jgi:hypothetical protein
MCWRDPPAETVAPPIDFKQHRELTCQVIDGVLRSNMSIFEHCERERRPKELGWLEPKRQRELGLSRRKVSDSRPPIAVALHLVNRAIGHPMCGYAVAVLRRRHQARRPANANATPGRPAPAMGLGTAETETVPKNPGLRRSPPSAKASQEKLVGAVALVS